jgi:hypothetical protein
MSNPTESAHAEYAASVNAVWVNGRIDPAQSKLHRAYKLRLRHTHGQAYLDSLSNRYEAEYSAQVEKTAHARR